MDPQSMQNSAKQQQQQQEQEEYKKAAMKSILSPEANERLARVKIVKPEKAAQLENQLMSMAKSGKLKGVVSEAQLSQLLETVSEKEVKVTTMRKKNAFDSDSDDEDDDDLY